MVHVPSHDSPDQRPDVSQGSRRASPILLLQPARTTLLQNTSKHGNYCHRNLDTITQGSANRHDICIVNTCDPPAISRPRGIFTAVKILESGNTCADADGVHSCLGCFCRWQRGGSCRNTAVSPPKLLDCQSGRDRRRLLQYPAVIAGRLCCGEFLLQAGESSVRYLELAKQEPRQPACIMNVYRGSSAKPR